jgi:hypothetical protein
VIGREKLLQVRFYTASGAAADQIAELEDIGIDDEIEDAVALAAPGDERAVVEGLQMLRDIGLRAAEDGSDFAHGAFAVFEELEDAESGRFAEEAEAAGDGIEEAAVGEGTEGDFGLFGGLTRFRHDDFFYLDYSTI